MDIVEKDGVPISKRGKFSGRKYTYRCPHCFSMGVSLSSNDDIKCSCGSFMEMIEHLFLKDGKKIGRDITVSEIHNNVLKQIKHLCEIQ